MYQLSYDECLNKFHSQNNEDNNDYELVRYVRIFILAISSFALLINIIIIVKKQQYVFPTIQLLMFVQVFYIFSLVSVIPHNPDFNLGVFQDKNLDNFLYDLSECIATENKAFPIAFEGFLNLVSYSISYWLAVLITLYIKMVLQDNYKSFIKKNAIKIYGVIAMIIVWYAVPFVLTFYNNVPFSFGPTGYQYSGQFYFFYSGIINRYQNTENELLGQILVFLWIMLVPFLCFFYHSYLLYLNHKHMKELIQSQQQINARQLYSIKSGKLSYLIFFVQIVNVVKSIMVMQVDGISWIVTFIVNVIFDLLGFILIVFYFKFYYKQGRQLSDEPQNRRRSILETLRQNNI